MPTEIETLLRSRPDLEDVILDRIMPEQRIDFDEFPGEPRNADLAIAAHDASGVLAITVEGKADEPSTGPSALF